MKIKISILVIAAFTLGLMSPIWADKITDETNQRLVHFFNNLGEKTNWFFAIELSDDEQKAKELADKLESSPAASLGSIETWDEDRIVSLLQIQNVFSFHIDSTRRCIDLQYDLPKVEGALGAKQSFCNVKIGDPDLLVPQASGQIDLNKVGLKLDNKAPDYLSFLEKNANFTHRILTISGKEESGLSNPEARVVCGPCTVFDFLNALCLTQKHSRFLYMAYFVPDKEQRVDIYTKK